MQKQETSLELTTQSLSTRFWGERLQLIREFRALTQKEMGHLLGLPHSVISDYEKGKRFPSDNTIRVLADKTGFLESFFLQRLDDPFTEAECSFRHRRNTSERLKAQVRAHATLLGIIVSAFRNFLRFPAFNVPSITVTTDKGIEDAADEARRYWNLDLNAPILQVGRAIERAGVIIIPHSIDTKKIDAFSRQGNNSLIFLNRGTGSRPSRWNFDLAHEYAHLVMHRDVPTGSIQTEKEAEAFAGAFLLPRIAFSREFRSRRMSWAHIFEIKQRWHVSAAAIVRRARRLDLIDEMEYRRAFQYMSSKDWRANGEPYEPNFQEPELFTNALELLETRGKKSLNNICAELGLSDVVFADITGYHRATKEDQACNVFSFP